VKGLAPNTVETIYGIFASTMRGAVRGGYLRKSPCVDIRLPEKIPTVVRLLTPAEVLALADAMPGRYSLLVAGTGLRQDEAFGLALDRVDSVEGMVTVDQQVIIANRHPILAPPKTASSVRDVPAPFFVQEAIADHAERLELGADDVLCRTPRRTLLRRDYYNREIWKPAVKAAGLMADTTFHDLRHTFASTALAEGVPISEVSRWLGHKSITTTVDLSVTPGTGGRRTGSQRPRRRLRHGARQAPGGTPPWRMCTRCAPASHRRWSEEQKGVSRPVGRVLCTRLRGPAVIHLGLPLPAASCGLPASIGRAALKRSRRPTA
jgi:integrase